MRWQSEVLERVDINDLRSVAQDIRARRREAAAT